MLLEELLEQEKREQQQQQPALGPKPQLPNAPNPNIKTQVPPTSIQAQPSMMTPNSLPTNPANLQPGPQPPQQIFEYDPGNPIGQQGFPPGAMRPRLPRPMGPGVGVPMGGVPAQGMIPNNPSYPPRMRRAMPNPQWHPRHPQEITLQQRGPIGATSQPHPALIRPDAQVPPPPPPFNVTPPPMPPENPQTEEDRQKEVQYQQWLDQKDQAITQRIKYYEKEISAVRKQRKVSKH